MTRLLRPSNTVRRRSLMSGALLLVTGQAACARDDSGRSRSSAPSPTVAPSETRTTVPSSGSSVILAYFSRAGENYYHGDRIDLEVGNTEVVAGLIADRIGCEVHRIEGAEPYSDDYDETVARNVREQEADARPAIADPLSSIDDHDVVLLASPIWNIRPPMIMQTFAEMFDFTGKTVHPITTYAVSGLGDAVRDYAAACPGAELGKGLAVQGEDVTDDAARVAEQVDAWLRQVGLPRAAEGSASSSP
jgi:flavodoxin